MLQPQRALATQPVPPPPTKWLPGNAVSAAPPSETAGWHCRAPPSPAKRLPGIARSATVSSRYCL